MATLTTAEKHASKLLLRPLLDAMGKDHTINTVSFATGISKDALSKWICGDISLSPSNQVKVRAFVDEPTIAKPKYKDSDRNK